MKRKRYTKEFKAKVALEAVKGQKTVNQIDSEFGIHVSQINDWKRQLLAGLPEVFDRKGIPVRLWAGNLNVVINKTYLSKMFG